MRETCGKIYSYIKSPELGGIYIYIYIGLKKKEWSCETVLLSSVLTGDGLRRFTLHNTSSY